MTSIHTPAGDGQTAAITLLRDQLGDFNPLSYVAGFSVGARVRTDRSIETPGLPYVQVNDDGPAAATYPIVTYGPLRCTIWHTDPDNAFDLAQLCMGILLSHTGDVLAACTFGSGVTRTIDPDSGVDLATFTVNAKVRSARVSA